MSATDIIESSTDIKELKNLARTQQLVILELQKKIEILERKEQKLNHVEVISRSAEQDLCEIELKRLRDIALDRSLTLEEAKRMDLYVKNLYIAKGKPADIETTGKKQKELSEAELIQIALLKE